MAEALARSRPALANRPPLRTASAIGLAAARVGGCVNLPGNVFTPPPPDVTSPLAADIRKLNLRDAAYPGWLQVPGQPTDVRPGSAWTRNIYNTLRLRRQMQAVAVLNPQSLYGAEAFAKDSRDRAAAPLTPAEAAALPGK